MRSMRGPEKKKSFPNPYALNVAECKNNYPIIAIDLY
jgi:hypothetical protein